MDIKQIIKKQQIFFDSGKTLDIDFRLQTLKKIEMLIKSNENKILDALQKDLGKSAFEGYMCEVGMTLSEITYLKKNLKKLAKPHKKPTPLAQFHAKSFELKVPYGNVLILSPWNYPFMLAFEPLVDAVAAGNTVVLKPGSYAKNTSKIMKEIIQENFQEDYIAVVEGGRDVNQELLDQKFNYIFFTGSKDVGKLVLQKAANHITPVTLELGGKSPCIVDKSANLQVAARRLVFGKFLNLGQTCVAPDYLLLHKDVENEFKALLIQEVKKQFGENPLENKNYGKIINEKHFDRLKNLIKGEKILIGGKVDNNQRIEPTILEDINLDCPVMQEEIFGPILPIITFSDHMQTTDIISHNSHPLALYVFANDKKVIKHYLRNVQFGGGCINDTIIHLATSKMGFGGVGESGMGSYHGKYGFNTFSHTKSIVDKKNWIDLPIRYQPYNSKKEKLLRKFMK